MKRLIIFLGILLLFAANIAFAAPVGKVTYVEGRVDVLKPGKTVAIPVSKGDPVDVGDIYRAKSNSKAEITFVNRNALRIAQNTRTEIKEYAIEGDRSSGVIKLYRGKVQAIAGEEFVKRAAAFAEGNKLEIHTPNAVAGVRGTIFAVSFEGGVTWILCSEGRVYAFSLANPTVIIIIPANFVSNISGDNPPTQPMSFGKGLFEIFIIPWVSQEFEKENIWQQVSQETTTVSFFLSEFSTSLVYYDGSWTDDGTLEGIMTGIGSLWTATQANPIVSILAGNYFEGTVSEGHIWATEVFSYNYLNGTNTTYDGGAYKGYLGGFIDSGYNLEARFTGIYVDPDGHAGFLIGNFSGTAFPSPVDIFGAEGSIYPVQIWDSVGISPGNLYDSLQSSSYSVSGAGDFNAGGSIGIDSDISANYNLFTSNRELAIWKNMVFGTYSGTTSNDWTLSTASIDWGSYYSVTLTTGTTWSGNTLLGSTIGFGADIATAKTWVSIGETLGTYDASGLWQAIQIGQNLETTKFLEMAGKIPGTPNIGALQALNIPCVEVGRATLSGVGNNFTTLSMNDVIFFASNALAKPTIWATGSVTGSYTAPPVLGTAINVSGPGLSADFKFQGWNSGTGNWIATVDGGSGGFNGSTSFWGASAGTGAGPASGSITGTASGVAN